MSLTGYLVSDGITDLSAVFMNINGPSILSQNIFEQKTIFAGGVDLSNSFLYGRNDGYAFNTAVNSMYPIGYSSSTLMTYTGLASGAKFVTSIPIYPGSWLVNYRCQGKGNTANTGTYSTSAAIYLDLSANSDITYINNRLPKSITPLLPKTQPNIYVNPIPITTVIRVSANTTLQASALLSGITGNSGNTVLIEDSNLVITKIA